ncbi:MAG: ATP-binding protein [Chloroflexota bacterium]
MGFVQLNVARGHPDFGKAVPCSCSSSNQAERRKQSLMRISNMDGLQQKTFDNFVIDYAQLEVSYEIGNNLKITHQQCLEYAMHPFGWLLISGRYGCGKTHLAAAIANMRLERGESVIFMTVPDLLDHLRATYNPSAEWAYDDLFDQVRNTPLLILDDFGTHNGTAWAQEKLFQILNHRYNKQAPTVITTNQRIEDMEHRIASRLSDFRLVESLAITAPDYRTGGKRTKPAELSTLGLHQNQTFSTFNHRRSDLVADELLNLEKITQMCLQFAQNPQGWLVLHGTYGCGKTHLAAAIANYQVAQNRREAMFVVVPDLLDHLRASFSPQSNMPYDRRFDEIKRVPLLILDDLGTESATPWAKEKMFQLLNHRYIAMLPTVITTTTSLNEIDPRLQTRMLDTERCRFCEVTAPGYRGRHGGKRKRGA